VLAAGVLQTLDPDRFPPHPFYENWLEDISDSSDKYRQVYDLLADERSRAIFDALLGYRISGDAPHLAPVVDRNIFYPTELFRFTESEVYVDGGCYTGDTIQWFIERTGGHYERIIGFEPDPDNYPALVRNFGGKPRIELRQLGLFRDRRVLR